MQVTDTVLMVRPASFAYNPETAANNFFQNQPKAAPEEVQQKALQEFDAMVETLQRHGIQVDVVEDTPSPCKPNAIFPNNWFTAAHTGVLSVFPMFAPSRRLEKRNDILHRLAEKYKVVDVQDWSEFEAEDMYLEGTGSMVLDHKARVVYACISKRTHPSLVERFASAQGYKAITFHAHDEKGNPVYHTNVMLCIGDGFAVLCSKAITDDNERVAVAQLLETTGHENIYISFEQMSAFAGNMLHLKNRDGKKFIVLSTTAFKILTADQKVGLQQYGTFLPVDVSTIEQVEGGSARCMMAEIFLPAKDIEG